MPKLKRRSQNNFNVFNILYSSNNLFLKKNWCSISRKIHKEFKINFFGEYFLDEKYCVIPSNIILSKDLTRNICVKNLPSDMKFDILYSEII